MRTFNKIALLPAIFLLANCGNPGSETGTVGIDKTSTFASKPALLNISLVDAPNQDLTKVNVNIKYVELWLEKGGTKKRVIVAEGMGNVDLLTLQNGINLRIINTEMPAQVQVREIRLVLEESGHYANKLDGSVCDMKTPSAQRSGVKIKMPESVTMENGNTYSIVIDFDALKSVVQKGNGGCNLKPVLHLKSATKVVAADPAVDLTGGTDYSNTGDTTDPAAGGTGAGDGFVSGTDASTGGDLIPIADLPIYF